ncbi:carbohydrate-binding module family 1 protein [Piromyces sp. E2]|nr:carbohydrate-binding module family 1 protein [Piromyces sp. E2]|eukprot:OUM59350.1 carbohydrate-binding module family 1 protein [Piromyces sp. E2]
MKFIIYIYFLLYITIVFTASCSKEYGQCGGSHWNGPICCPIGYTCKFINDWYSQCVPNKQINDKIIKPVKNVIIKPEPIKTTMTIPNTNTIVNVSTNTITSFPTDTKSNEKKKSIKNYE